MSLFTLKALLRNKIFLGLLALFFALFVISHFWKTSTKNKAISVATAEVVSGTLSPSLSAIGNMAAKQTADIKSQVSGQLISIPVIDGQHVNKDQILFVIDPKTFQANVDQAKATLAKDEAAANNAESDLKRYQALIKKGYVSKEFYEQTKSNAQSAKAQVNVSKAALASAQIQLEHTQIRAPFAGRLSSLSRHEGDLVSSNDTTPLTTLNQFDPIDVEFSLPAHNIASFSQALANNNLTVAVVTDTSKNTAATGNVYFIDNAINSSTGMIAMKASVNNEKETLWPGEFVRVQVKLPALSHVLLIPTIALQQNQSQAYYVYTIDQKNKAHRRDVIVGPEQKDQTAIFSGLKEGEKVVTQGQFEISDGSLVDPTKIG